jgi:predicted nucleic acid-binding protein
VRYLLDTNVLSEVRKPRPDDGVAAWLASVTENDLYLSVLVLGEIRVGIDRLRPRDQVQASVFEEWLVATESAFADRLLSVDAIVAQTWGRLQAVAPLPAIDSLMVATALCHGLIMVTRDTSSAERAEVPWLDPWTGRRG